MYRLGLLLALVVTPLAAQPAFGDPFFVDGVRELPVDLITLETTPEQRLAALERDEEAYVRDDALVAIVGFRLSGTERDPDGFGRILLGRDAQGRVRRAEYSLAERVVDGRARNLVASVTHAFDEQGRAATIRRRSRVATSEACGGIPESVPQRVIVDREGRLLRLTTGVASGWPGGCSPPAPGPAAIPAFATVDALVAGLGLPAVEAMPWQPARPDGPSEGGDAPPPAAAPTLPVPPAPPSSAPQPPPPVGDGR